jgi:peroxiredoxin Q/BCP
MAQLRQDTDRFTERDAAILIIGPEDARKFATYFSKNKLPFIGLPDPKHQVLKKYGQEVNLFKLGRMPAQVLVDKAGIARFVHYGNSMHDIPSNEEILSLVDEMNQEASVSFT